MIDFSPNTDKLLIPTDHRIVLPFSVSKYTFPPVFMFSVFALFTCFIQGVPKNMEIQ